MINKEEEFDDDSKLINDIQELRDYISNIKDGEFPDDFDSFFNSNFETFRSEMGQMDYEKTNLEYTSEDKELLYNYKSDSGFDLYSTEEINIDPFGRSLVPTGVKFNIPMGHEIQVRSKSGLAINQGLMVLNSPGTVDCFSEDMKILTIDGEKHIKDLKINDIVFSFNEKSLEIEKDIVVKIFDTDIQDILKIETEEGVLEVTPNSEIYTNRGIVFAKDLQENDEIIVFF